MINELIKKPHQSIPGAMATLAYFPEGQPSFEGFFYVFFLRKEFVSFRSILDSFLPAQNDSFGFLSRKSLFCALGN